MHRCHEKMRMIRWFDIKLIWRMQVYFKNSNILSENCYYPVKIYFGDLTFVIHDTDRSVSNTMYVPKHIKIHKDSQTFQKW